MKSSNSDDSDEFECYLKINGNRSHSEICKILNTEVEPNNIEKLNLSGCSLVRFPATMMNFCNLTSLNMANNKLRYFLNELFFFENLEELNLSQNEITSYKSTNFQTNFSIENQKLPRLKRLLLSENQLEAIPEFVYECTSLIELHIASNRLKIIEPRISKLSILRNLYLGANKLSSLPCELGLLTKLQHLHVSDNKLNSVPAELSELSELRCLELHNNNLHTLPQGLLSLNHLVVLSLRSNPLVMNFVENHVWDVPLLQELAGRAVLLNYQDNWRNIKRLPSNLFSYLASARRCENPQCVGVYFTSHVENVKFKDFCGKYRVPLLQYLCSPYCSSKNSQQKDPELTDSTSHSRQAIKTDKMINRVLLG